jgi:sugar phosphate isomerase/epimerase
MTQPIALQLYTVRDQLARDFEGTIRRVADIGYAGVETASFPVGVSAAAAKALFDEVGLTVCAAHAPLPLGEAATETLDRLAALGCDRLVCAWLPPNEYATLGAAYRTCERLNQAAAVCARHGLRLGVHNHWFEFQPLGDTGQRPYEIWLEQLDPRIFFELDTYWAKVGGVEPVAVLERMGPRVELLHVKDGPADTTQSDMTAVGTGALDYGTIIPAASAAAWLIVELDHCATDMFAAIDNSYRYLVDRGLGHGRA